MPPPAANPVGNVVVVRKYVLRWAKWRIIKSARIAFANARRAIDADFAASWSLVVVMVPE